MKKHLYTKLTKWNALKPLGLSIYVLIKRALPITAFALLAGISAIVIDRAIVEGRSGEDYVKYTQFSVLNARAGENVYFKVCREHKEDYNFNGVISVYIYRNADPKETPLQVHSQDIRGSIRGECENKVIYSKDFIHDPGTYKMGFCVDFEVKYHKRKTVCKDSNIYTVYAQPEDVNGQIEYYQKLIESLQAREAESRVGAVQQPSDNAVSQTPITQRYDTQQSGGVATAPSSSGTTAGSSGSAGGGNAGTTTPPPAPQGLRSVPVIDGTLKLFGL